MPLHTGPTPSNPTPLFGSIVDETATVSYSGAASSRQSKSKPRHKNEPSAPSRDRIPLPSLSTATYDTRRRLLRDYEKRARSNAANAASNASVCLYTVLNASSGVTAATLAEGLEAAAIGYANATLAWHALGAGSFAQMRDGAALAELDVEDAVDRANEDDGYDESTRTQMFVLRGHNAPIYATSFSADSRLLLTASRDETVKLWSRDMRRSLATYRFDSPVWDAQFSSRGVYFAAASASVARLVGIYTTERLVPQRLLAGATADVTCLDWHPNCNYVIGGSDDKTVRVWDVLDGSCVQTLDGHSGVVHSVKVSPNGRHVVSASDDGTIRLYDLTLGKTIGVQEIGPTPHRVPIRFSPDGAVFAVGAPSNAISFFSVDSVATANQSTKETRISPDGFHLVTHMTKKTSLYDLQFARRNTVVGLGVMNF